MKLYISPEGNDTNDGRTTNNALLTLEGAEKTISVLRKEGFTSQIICYMLPGSYFFAKPYSISPIWNFVTLEAQTPQTVQFTGSREISGFKECQVNGRRAFQVYLPEVEQGIWYFKQLFVNGQVSNRTRLPEAGYYWMEGVPGVNFQSELFDGSSSFIYSSDNIKSFHNLFDTEVVVLHFWIEERMPIRCVNEGKHIVHLGKKSIFSLKDDFLPRYAKYYVENTIEGLLSPGQWYLDSCNGQLYYLPFEEETVDSIVVTAPCTSQLLAIEGSIEQHDYVEHFNVKGIEFAYTNWYQPVTIEYSTKAGIDYASAPQAADSVPGVITLRGTKNCSISECSVHDIGFYGFDIQSGCENTSILHNEIYRGGAGGIKAGGADIYGSPAFRCSKSNISYNHIYDCGKVFYSATGIFLKHTAENHVWHNHIHDMFYSGISSGWVWGYGPNISCQNSFCFNHIHDLGKGILSDMGGIYLLGIQPGTEVKNNLIYNVKSSNYGGWALYTDEGSSHIVLENNICLNTSSHVFHQHYGGENIIRNNILCFGEEGIIAFPKGIDRMQFTFTGNIVITKGSVPFHNKYDKVGWFISDCNLFFDVSEDKSVNLDEWLLRWQMLGYDAHSIIGDPGFISIDEMNFDIPADSPAFKIGFHPICMKDVGV